MSSSIPQKPVEVKLKSNIEMVRSGIKCVPQSGARNLRISCVETLIVLLTMAAYEQQQTKKKKRYVFQFLFVNLWQGPTH